MSQRPQRRIKADRMRGFFRHPADIPIEILHDGHGTGDEALRNVSSGGLSFRYHEVLSVGYVVRVRIAVTAPAFEAPCRVVWCHADEGAWQIGVEFFDPDHLFQARMIEQVCHIEQYRQDVRAQQGRDLSGHDAAIEWIARYARVFPDPAQD